MRPDIEVPVLIVGGGGSGLTSSLLLSHYGVESLLVSRYAETSHLPKAHYINQRTMEIFADLEIADAVYAISAPPDKMARISWYSALSSPNHGEACGRRLATIEAWDAGYKDPNCVAASPCPGANVPQIRLEPLLKAHAEAKPQAQVRFFHELVDLEKDADSVTATVLDRASGERYTVRSQYLLGTDGGRTVGDLVGIELTGLKNIRRFVSVHMSIDLAGYAPDDDSMFVYVHNPDYPEHVEFGCFLMGIGPTRWGAQSKEWVAVVSYDLDDPAAEDDQKVMSHIGKALGITGFSPTVHAISRWVMEGVLADRFQEGRVFLLGDAAKRNPPLGGLGLNTAIHDTYNLCWKVAAVVHGRAGADLLETYEAERRPVGAAVVETAVEHLVHFGKVASALGVSSAKSIAENWAALEPLWSDRPDSHSRRHAVSQAVGWHTFEFHQAKVAFGYTYTSNAIVDDGTPVPDVVDKVRIYQPSTHPGHPLPHAWVERAGERVALGSLVHGGHFTVIAGDDGDGWVEAAQKIARKRNLPLRAVRVGFGEVEYVDVRCAWLKNRGITSTGVVLVRPDRFVGFRSAEAVEDPLKTLSTAIDHILALG